MLETAGQVWLRRHWVLAGFAFTGFLLLASALLTPNLLRVRNAAHYSELASDGAIDSKDTRVLPADAKSTLVAGATFFSAPQVGATPNLPDLKITRTSSMELLVTHPADEAEKIRQFAESMGGYGERSEVAGSGELGNASITILVPSGRMEEMKAQLRKLSTKVESEKTDAQDVTRQYVDVQARLRNLRAEEAQYLQIMHSARKVQDMLDISEKLSAVRGQIEQTQAEFETLSKQVEMVSIAISLRVQPKPEGFALNWHPMQQLEISLHDALDGLADYATAMTAALLYLPVILLWLATIVLGAAATWRGLRWTARVFFGFPQVATVEKAAS